MIFPFSRQVILNQPCWGDCTDELKNKIVSSIWDARKPSTISKYCYSVRKFLTFCKEISTDPILPFSAMTIAQYLETIKESSNSSVTDALTSIKWLHYFIPGINSFNNPLNDEFLARIVESSKRSSNKEKNRKKPLTSDIIGKILGNLPSDPSLEDLRNTLIPVLAFALLLRHDELSHLNCSHFTAMSEGLKVHIPSSKTDTYRDGKYVFLSKKNSSVYNLVFRYISKAHLDFNCNHFFFCPIVKNRSDLTCSIRNQKLPYETYNSIVKGAVAKIGLDPREYGTHSARSGGASTLYPYVSQYELMLSGRWADPRSLGSYVEIATDTRFDINSRLSMSL